MNVPHKSTTLSDYVEHLPADWLARKEYDDLVKTQEWMYCLEAAGVSSWEGWDMAQEAREEG